MRLMLFALVALLGLDSTLLAAQPAVPTVASGTRIFVTLKAGGPPVEGSLLTLSPTTVALLVDDTPRTVALDQVRRIQRDGDSSRDGALKGALVLGLACMLICQQGVSSGNEFAAVILGNSAIGALFGWQFDRDHVARSTVYPVKRDWRDDAFPR